MSEPKRRFFSGNTLRQAQVLAAGHYGIEPEELAYTPIEKRHGFLSTRRKVVIEVDPDHPRRPPGAAAPAVAEAAAAPPSAVMPPAAAEPPSAEDRPPRGDKPPRSGDRPPRSGDRRVAGIDGPPRREERPTDEAPPTRPRAGEVERPVRRSGRRPRHVEAAERLGVTTTAPPEVVEGEEEGLIALPEAPRRPSERYPLAEGPVAAAAERGLRHLLEVTGLELSFRILQGEGRLEIELSGEDSEVCSSEEGELLRAVEHLLPRLIRTLAGEAVPCRVDCDNFHEIWEERLRSLAQRMADEVRRRGRPRTLEPMNPADRRIVHMTLADDPAVETQSEGEGYFKRITIRPV